MNPCQCTRIVKDFQIFDSINRFLMPILPDSSSRSWERQRGAPMLAISNLGLGGWLYKDLWRRSTCMICCVGCTGDLLLTPALSASTFVRERLVSAHGTCGGAAEARMFWGTKYTRGRGQLTTTPEACKVACDSSL